MKVFIVFILIVIFFLVVIFVQVVDEYVGYYGVVVKLVFGKVQLVDGQVKKIDKLIGKVILVYGLLVNFDMLVMMMVFQVKNVGWFDQMKVGDKICFKVDSIDGKLIVVQFELVK